MSQNTYCKGVVQGDEKIHFEERPDFGVEYYNLDENKMPILKDSFIKNYFEKTTIQPRTKFYNKAVLNIFQYNDIYWHSGDEAANKRAIEHDIEDCISLSYKGWNPKGPPHLCIGSASYAMEIKMKICTGKKFLEDILKLTLQQIETIATYYDNQ